METKRGKIVLSSLVLIFVSTGTILTIQEENGCMNIGKLYEKFSYLQAFLWPVEYSSQWQFAQDTKQRFKTPFIHSFYDSLKTEASLKNLESFKDSFLANRLFSHTKTVINETDTDYEAKGIILSDFINCQQDSIESYGSCTNEHESTNKLEPNPGLTSSSVRNTESDILSTTSIRTETNFHTGVPSVAAKAGFKQDGRNVSLLYTPSNVISLTSSLHPTKCRPFLYITTDQQLVMSSNYNNPKEFVVWLEYNSSEGSGDISITSDSVATPSIDTPTLQNDIKVTLLAYPSEAEVDESFISYHSSVSNTLELLGSIRSLPNSSDYNQETSSVTSTPVMSDSSVQSYSNIESTTTQENSANNSQVMSSRSYSSPFEHSLSPTSYSTNDYISSSTLNYSVFSSDNFSNTSEENS